MDSKTPKRINIKLTDEQRKQVKAATGKDAEALELGVEELEERIAPMTYMKFSQE
jgi:hypothetical protein